MKWAALVYKNNGKDYLVSEAKREAFNSLIRNRFRKIHSDYK